MKTVNFAEDFPKLQSGHFSTIRKNPKKLRTGEVVVIKSPNHRFKAVVVSNNRLYVRDVVTHDLTNDTGTRSREEALMVLRKFYPDLDEDSLVQVLWFVPDGREGMCWE